MTDASARMAWRRLRSHLRVPLFRNAYFLMLSSGLMSALGVPFWALAAHLYSARNVGLSATMVSAMSLVSGAGTLGMSSITVRYLPAAGTRTRRFVVLSYLGTGSLTLVLAVVAASTSHLWSPSLRFLGDDTAWFVLFVAATVTWTIFSLEDSVMTSLHETRWVPVENATFAVARLVLVVTLAGAARRSGIFLACIVPGMFLIFPVNLAIFTRFLPRRASAQSSGPTWTVAELRKMIGGNYLGSLWTLCASLLLPVLVTNEVNVSAAGYFYVPWMLTAGVVLVAANMSTSLSVETALAETEVRKHTLNAIAAILRIIGPAMLVIFIFAPQILSLFGPEYVKHGTSVLRILMLGAIPNAIGLVGLSVARFRHDGRLVAVVQILVAVIILGLSALLLPRLGIIAVGWAVLLAVLVGAAMVAPTLNRALARVAPEGQDPPPAVGG